MNVCWLIKLCQIQALQRFLLSQNNSHLRQTRTCGDPVRGQSLIADALRLADLDYRGVEVRRLHLQDEMVTTIRNKIG